MWEFYKERVYLNNSRSLEEMTHNTEQTVTNTDPEILHIVVQNTLKRVDACLQGSGGHFQHLL
jgi:hypothetical protein